MLAFIAVQRPQQVQVLSAMAKTIWEEYFTPLIGADQVAYMLERFQSAPAISQQLGEGYRYFLLEMEGNIAGYTGVHPEAEALFLSKLYLQKAYRGKHLATQAMAFLVGLSQGLGLRRIYLTVNRHNTPTIRAYQSLGFAKVREQKTDIGGGYFMDDFVMEKTW